MKRMQSVEASVTDVLLTVAYIAVVAPFLTMFVWNTLVSGMFNVFTIGYGGAWTVIVIRAFFLVMTRDTKERTPEESLKQTMRGYARAAILSIATAIIGLSLGYL